MTQAITMTQAFVGSQSVAADQLKPLLESLPAPSRYYFLRWVHKVSGFVPVLPPEFPSPKGEMITPGFEVRWQQTHQGYDLLILAHAEIHPNYGFEALGNGWIVSAPLRASLSAKGKLQDTAEDRQDTRFPKPLIYPDGLKLQQQYFQDQQTRTTHFVALTLVAEAEKKS